jgi:hypothetical protein
LKSRKRGKEMEKREFPFVVKLRQFIIQFAFRIPIRKNLTSGERETLEEVLRELDSEHFQLFEEDASKRDPSTLLQVIRQLPVGAGTVMIPSFVLTRDSFSFIWPVWMIDGFVLDFTSFDTSEMNKKICGWVVKLQDAISNLNCQRTGKIYEIILGPFLHEEKLRVFSELFSIDLKDVGEVNLTFTRYIENENFTYNVLTNINYIQPTLQHEFNIRIRVDINNRKLERSLEPTLMQRVWNFADSIIFTHLGSLLKI